MSGSRTIVRRVACPKGVFLSITLLNLNKAFVYTEIVVVG
jgi:hypothetical protein